LGDANKIFGRLKNAQRHQDIRFRSFPSSRGRSAEEQMATELFRFPH